MMKRTFLILAALLVALVPAFSAESEAIVDEEHVVTVISVADEGEGVFVFECIDADDIPVIYRADAETKTDKTLQEYAAGAVLAIKDNGIATKSIPAQMWALEIREVPAEAETEVVGLTRDVVIKNVAAEEDGIYRFDVVDADGTAFVYRANADTEADKALELYVVDSNVRITDNGIATLSIPAQMVAVRIVTVQEPIEAEAAVMPIEIPQV